MNYIWTWIRYVFLNWTTKMISSFKFQAHTTPIPILIQNSYPFVNQASTETPRFRYKCLSNFLVSLSRSVCTLHHDIIIKCWLLAKNSSTNNNTLNALLSHIPYNFTHSKFVRKHTPEFEVQRLIAYIHKGDELRRELLTKSRARSLVLLSFKYPPPHAACLHTILTTHNFKTWLR